MPLKIFSPIKIGAKILAYLAKTGLVYAKIASFIVKGLFIRAMKLCRFLSRDTN
jgi:hypothetical protein